MTANISEPQHPLGPRAQPPLFGGAVFYGWVMLPIAMLGMICTSPGQTFGVAAFNDSWRESLNLSLTQLTGAYMLGTLLAALAMPYVGRLIDRHGPRRTMTGVVILFGMACIYTSQVTGLLTLLVAFLFLRMFGQGALSLVSVNTVAYWFNRRLGFATGLYNVGMAGAFALAPAINLWLINTVGWRWAYVMLGLAVWTIMLPLLATLYRDRPEDIGQVPDGRPPQPQPDEPPEIEPDFTLAEAARTALFWVMAFSTASWAMIGTALIFHMLPLMEWHGLAEGHAAAAFATFGIAMAATQPIGGWLADRVPLKMLLALSLSGVIGAVSLMNWIGGPWLPYTFGGLLGSAQGLIMVISNPIWRRNYGRIHLGKIRGSLAMLMVGSSALGPFLLGLAADRFGGYSEILLIFTILPAPMVILALLVRPPKYPPPSRP